LVAVAELVAVVIALEKPPEEGEHDVEVAVDLDGFVERAGLDFVVLEPPVAQVESDWDLA
jgi:hypothetical protein